MRSEKEMLELILNVAKEDERILAVIMNGSRTNPNVKKDIFQDYDIVYVVKENKPFIEDEQWIDVFGERLYMQCPEKVDQGLGLDVDFDKCYAWLMQLADGNRLDLTILPLEEVNIEDDKLSVILLDKNHVLPSIDDPTDQEYWVKKPTQEEFWSCCNEFWWCLNNVAKGLWREEILYVQQAYYEGSHVQLIKLFDWLAGYEYNYQISTGKASKYLEDYLPTSLWNRLRNTYINGQIEEIWKATFTMCDLFHEVALDLSEKLGFVYNTKEAHASLSFLKHVYQLPKDAKEIMNR